LDELCYRNAAFIKSCLESASPTVSAVAHHGVYYGCIGRNVSGVAPDMMSLISYVLLDVYTVSSCVAERISSQLTASVLFLLELLFIRDVSFRCSLLSSHDIDELIDIVCTS